MLDLEVQKLEAWYWSWELEAVSGIGRDGCAVYLFPPRGCGATQVQVPCFQLNSSSVLQSH